MKMRIVSLSLASFVFTLGIRVCLANPTGGTVVGGDGNGTINGSGTPVTTINQRGNRIIINWTDFSIGAGEVTRFVQPSSTSWALNRIISGNPSMIYGTLQANGHVMVLNQNGILVGAGGKIDTKGFVASTLDLRDSAFMKGGTLTLSGNSTASVRNEGTIQALGGDVFLIGNTVENSGTISAPQGTVGLAAGSSVKLVQAGNERISVLAGNANGAAANGVHNVGTVEGASAELKAAGGNIYALAINNEGVVRANSIVNQGGHVYLRASGGNIQNSGTISANKADGSGGTVILDGGHNADNASTVVNSGTIEARGDAAGTKGGKVQIVGDHVGLLDHAVVDVSGDTGGGTALIGGDYHGGNPNVQNAERTYVSSDAIIRADGLTLGDGGKVVVWADDVNRYFGNISARGGVNGGNGGFAEVSGKNSLVFNGAADMQARGHRGSIGQLLLDPKDIIVSTANPGGGSVSESTSGALDQFSDNPTEISWITPANLVTLLNAANVIFQANNDISFHDSVTATSGGHDLTLRAGRSIDFQSGANLTLNGGGSFSATFNDGGATAANRDPGAATFTMASGTTITARGGISIQGGILAADSSGATSIAANTGDISLAGLSTRGPDGVNANGVAGGNITVINNAAAGKNITISGTLNASGSNGTGTGNRDGGDGGVVTLNASGTLSANAIAANGGDSTGNTGAAGNGSAIAITAGGNLALNGTVTSSGGAGTGGTPGPGGNAGTINIVGSAAVAINSALSAIGGIRGGNGAAITISAGTTLTTSGDVSSSGGNAPVNGGDAGNIGLTAGTGIGLGGNVTASGGTGSSAGNNGRITLNATAGGANQTAGAIVGGGLLLQGAGAFNLTRPGNNVVTLAGNPNGTINYVDANGLTIGTVGAVSGLSSGGNSISVATVNGFLTAADDVDAGAGTVSLTSGSSGNDNRLTVNSGTTVHGAGGITLVGDHMTLTGSTIDGGSSTVTLRQFENGTDISLGGLENSGVLAFTTAELDTVTAGVLKIGNANSGDITIDSAIAPANTTVLSLQAGGNISQGGGNTVNISSLALRAGGAITLNQGNNADTVAATAGGNINYRDADSVTVGTVDGITGVNAGANSVTLTAAGVNNLLTIALGANVNGDAGVTLVADQMDIQGTVTTSGTALLHGSTATRSITIGTDDTATSLGLVGTEVNNITANVLKIGDPSSGTITVTAPITVVNAPSLFLEGLQISQTAGSTLTVSGLTTLKSDGAGVLGNITMNEANSFGSLSLLSANGSSVQVSEGNSTALDNISVNNGSVTINSAGAISQVSGKTITVGLLASFNSTGLGLNGNITLNNSGNNFGSLGLSSANGNSVSVSESSGTALDNISVNSGTLTINSGGAISQVATKTITVGGLASFISSGSGAGGNITLDNLGNNFGSLALDSANGAAVSVHEASATALDDVSAGGTLAINSAGDITQVAGKTISAGGNSSFTAPVGNSINLGNSGNTLSGAVSFLANGIGNLLNVTIFNTVGLNLQGLTIDGNLIANSGDAISQSGALNVGGLASFTSTGSGANGNITLNDGGNNFGSLGLSSANGSAVSVTEAAGSGGTAGTLLDNVAVNGTLAIHAAGAINQVSGATINVGGLADFTSAGSGADGNIILANTANGGNNFGSLGLHSANGDEIGVLEASSTALDNVNLGSATGILIVGSGGDLTQVGGKTITVAGNTLFGAPAGSSILVANSGNTFNGSVGFVATTTGNLLNVAVSDTTSFDLQALTLDGSLAVNAGGPITQSGVLNIAGLATFTATGAGANGDITLINSGNNFGSLGLNSANGSFVQVAEGSATALDNVAVNGDLSITSGGDITQVAGRTVAVGGTAAFTSIPGASVLLGNAGNAFSGPVNFISSGIGNLLNITVRNNGAFNIQGLSIDGDLNVTANGAITDSGALRVGGTTTLAAGSGNDITLDNADDFVGAVDIVSARNVTLNDINSLTIGGALAGDLSTVSGGPTAFNTLSVGGLLTVVANGSITDNGSVTVGGATTLNAGVGSDIVLNNSDDFGGAVSIVNANNVTLVDVNSLTVGGNVGGSLTTLANAATTFNALNVGGNLNATANGLISDNGVVTVGGATSLAAGSGNDITLDNADDFGGAVFVVSGHNVTLNDVNSLTVGGLISGNLTTTANGATALNGMTVGGNLNVNANGLISDNANVTVAGTTTLAAGAGNDIILNDGDDFGGAVSVVSGRNVLLTDVNAIDLGASTVSGALTVVAGGDITDSGNLTVANAAAFATAGGNSIILDQSGNTFNGPVSFASTGGGNLQNVTVVDTTAFDITGIAVNGTFSLTAGGPVTQSGNITAPNLAVTSAGSVTLNGANQVDTVAIDAQGAIQYNDVNSIAIGSVAGVNGFDSHDNNITVTTGNGSITVNNTAAPVDVEAGDGTLTFTAGSADNGITIASGASVHGEGGVTFTADNMDIAGTLSSGAGNMLLQPFSLLRPLHFGPTDVAGSLNFSQGELDHITAHDLTIGNINTGPISGNATIVKPVTVGSLHILGGGIQIDVQLFANQLASLLAGAILPVPRIEVTSFSGAAIDVTEASKILPPGSIGTLFLQVPFVAVEEKKYKVEDASKWTTGRIAASGTTVGPQTAR
jgi:filamentous hemagglutinin family protein